ncbi:MAG: phosphate acyltransferase PlsX [Aquificaceae bacterium]|nr:phosphate acyltransferase PlsX [Aquificaceae bacterium]MDW8237662.1 phosphate acyltransferase PlsX [Aquificaceae bacterium]
MTAFAVDCMGGDFAPREIVKGCLLAWEELGIKTILVGQAPKIEEILRQEGFVGRLEVVDAPDSIAMNDPPLSVLRRKESSLFVAASLVKEGKAQGLISAGSTGAVLAVGKFVVGAMEGVERPAIGVVFPNLESRTFLIDVGANIDCKARHLLHFAVIGHTYSKFILGVENPRIGILSIGEEEGKGNELVREAYTLLKNSQLNFKGNAEGRDIFSGGFDVIVCDGFVGNIILKASESLGLAVVEMLKRSVKKNFLSLIGAFLMKPALMELRKKADFTEYGGIPLLGAIRPVIITHGKANAKAIRNSIKVANQFLTLGFNEKLIKSLNEICPQEVRN